MTFENIAHGLIRNPMAEICQRSYDAIIAPTGILSRHPHHQILYLRMDLRSASKAEEKSS